MKTLESGLALFEARVKAQKLTKESDKIISIIDTEDGDFSLIDGQHPKPYALYKAGASIKADQAGSSLPERVKESVKVSQTKEVQKNQSNKSIKQNNVMKKSTSTIQKMSVAVKKQAAKKSAPKKAAKKAGKSTAGIKNLPVQAIIDFVKQKQRSFVEVRAMLKKAGKKDSTINAQVGRMKNSPLLKVEGEIVKYKK